MIQRLHTVSRTAWALFFGAVVMTALVLSPFVLSLGMIGLSATALLERHPRWGLWWRKDLAQQWQQFWKHPDYWMLLLLFVPVLLGGLYSEDMAYFFRRLRLKLPLLLFPFVFFLLPRFSKRQYLGLHYFLLVMMAVVSLGIGINYALHFEEINASMLQGQAMPTPRNHIRFSLMLALAILAGSYLWVQQYALKYRWERWLILGLTFFLFIFIHILSVRSGLVVLYVGLVVFLLWYIFLYKKYILGLASLLGLCVLPFLAYQYIPSFRAKIDYARWDMKMYTQGEGVAYSDSERWISYHIGWQVFREAPVWGVGTGDLRREMRQRYAAQHPKMEAKLPHSQWLTVAATHGLVGLVLFILGLLYPFFYKKNYRHLLFYLFYTVVFLSFMVENTLETSIGLGFFVFFTLLYVHYLRKTA